MLLTSPGHIRARIRVYLITTARVFFLQSSVTNFMKGIECFSCTGIHVKAGNAVPEYLPRPSEAGGLGELEPPPPNNFHCITTRVSKIHKRNKKLPG